MSIKRFVWEKRISLRGNTLDYLSRLQKWQWRTPKEVEIEQQNRLKSLLKHSYLHTSYYRPILKKYGVVNEKGQIHLENFHSLPFLDKETIRKHYTKLQSNDLHTRKWYENTSGGSTGETARFIQDREYFSWNQAIKALYDEWSGRSLIDKQIRLWASEQDLMQGRESVRTHVGRWLRNERWFQSLRMTSEKMRNYIEEINQFQPVQILAYTESLYELARFIERENLPVYSPKSIMTSAGTLYPHMRETMERVFRTRVFNRYGSTEVGDIACECNQHRGLHVSAMTHYLEIIKPDGTLTIPGEVGEIVVTLLVNHAMPFIRYRIGDMGAWSTESCQCGRGLPLLREVNGRVTDIFVDKRGRLIDGRVFLFILDPKPFIQKFQVIQERIDLLRILIVPTNLGIDPALIFEQEWKAIRHSIQKVMECTVQFEFCEEILPTPSGKYRYTISHVRR